MKIFNSVLNTYPLIAHARGGSFKTEVWDSIGIPKVISNTLSSDITIISFFSGKDRMYLRDQLIDNNIYHINAAPVNKNYWVNTFKIKYLVESIKMVNTEYVLCLDGSDVFLSEDLTNILDKFKSFNADIVYNSTTNNFPPSCSDIENTHTKYKYLNAGAFIGKTKSILDFYTFILETEMSKSYKNLTSEQLRVRNGRNNYYNKESIVVDTNCILFQTLDKGGYTFNDNVLKIDI